jgi:uncharacterized membrane protein
MLLKFQQRKEVGMIDLKYNLYTILLGIIPISELRGAMPYAYFNHIPLFQAFLISVLSNLLVIPIVWIFLGTIHKLFYKMNWYKSLFDRTVEKARLKVGSKVSKYGYLGLMIFVGIPLPITGAWTGTLGAWILGLDRKKTFIFVGLGILLSGLIVATLLGLGVGLNSILIKKF